MKQLAWTLLAVAALTALSCKKEAAIQDEVVPDAPGEVINPGGSDWSAYDADKFLVSFTGTMEKTKAEIDVTNGVPSWSAGDLVLVYVAESGKSGKYQYDASEGKFYPVDAADIVAPTAGQTVYVYYPWADDLSVSGSTATMTLPAEFNGSSPAPMAGTVTVGDALSGISVPFKNLGAILHVKLTGSDTPTAVELANSNVALAGSASISWEGGIPKLSTSGTSKSVKALTGATAPAEVELCFLLPPSSEAMSDMSLKVIFEKRVGEVTYEPYEVHTRTAALSYARNELRHLTLNVGFFSGGDGSEAHPYQISSKEDFLAIATAVADETAEGPLGFITDHGTFFGSAGAHYIQTTDIDFADSEVTPIGRQAKPFFGVYDGDEKSISNFLIDEHEDTGNWTGLFGFVSGEVRKVSVVGAKINGYTHAGTLVGGVSGGSIRNCTSSDGFTKGSSGAVGGLIGWINGGTVSGCSISNVTVGPYDTETGTGYGGIVGYIAESEPVTIENCHTDAQCNISNAENKGNVGGIVGTSAIATFNDLTINGCTNAATLSCGTGENIGGIVGNLSNGTVSHCSNTGNITSGRGLAGGIAGQVSGGAVVEACWSEATITGVFNQIGGIVGGMSHGAIVCCHAKGDISGAAYVGGIVGLAKCSAQNKRVLIHQCLSQANVTASTGSSACSGGVVGGLRSVKYGTDNCEYAMVTHSVGWKASVKNTNTSACTRMGAFVGYVNSETGAATTNNKHTFLENCYTTLEESDLTWDASSPSASGGFIGEFIRGELKNCFYRISNNTQVAKTGSNTKWISPNKDTSGNLIPLEGFSAATLMTSLAVRTTGADVRNGSDIKYVGSEWTTTGKNGETLAFPLPKDLVDLGPEFYQ